MVEIRLKRACAQQVTQDIVATMIVAPTAVVVAQVVAHIELVTGLKPFRQFVHPLNDT